MKILIHAINGVGLGHIIRTLEVSKALIKLRKDVEIIFVTNSQFPQIISDNGFKYYQLKLNTKDVLESKVYYHDYASYNSLRLIKIIKSEYPDLILFDCELHESVIDFCVKKHIKTSFILRNKNHKHFDAIIKQGVMKKIDMILIPHNKLDVPKSTIAHLKDYDTVSFVGPIIKTRRITLDRNKKSYEKKNERNRKNPLNILITFSAGAGIEDNSELFSKVSNFLAQLKNNGRNIKDRQVKLDIITGPYFKQNYCNLNGFDYKSFEPDMLGKMKEADLIISSAGYNIINEIIYAQTPAILIPVRREEDNQFARAKDMEKKGCAKVVKNSIFQEIEDILLKNKLREMENKFPDILPGNDSAAKKISELLGNKDKLAVLCTNFLPFSDRFISDELDSLQAYEPNIFCINKEYDKEPRFKIFHKEKFISLCTPDFPFIRNKHMNLHKALINWCTEIIRSNNIKLLHAQYLSDALFFLNVKRITNLPLIVSVRGYDLYTLRNIDYSFLFSSTDLFLVRSEKMKKDLISKGCDQTKIIIHHSGIRFDNRFTDKNLSQCKDGNKINILMVGRFVEKKGTLLGIKIFNKVCQKYNNIQLNIIGDGILKEKILLEAEGSPFSEKIKIHGELPNNNVIKIMKQSHILLQPSITAKNGDMEGIPNSVMEAMALGVIVVASNHSGIPEIVKENKTGLIFKEGNLEGAVSKLSFAIENINKLQSMKRDAWNFVEQKFNIIKQTSLLERIYDSILDK